MEFRHKISASKNSLIIILNGKDEFDDDFWIALNSTKSQIENLQREIGKNIIEDFTKYGKILSHGDGLEPSEDQLKGLESQCKMMF